MSNPLHLVGVRTGPGSAGGGARPRSRGSALLAWSPALAALVVAVMTGCVIITLRDRADHARRVEVAIAEIHRELAIPEELLTQTVELPANVGKAPAAPGSSPGASQAPDPASAVVARLAALRGEVSDPARLDDVISGVRGLGSRLLASGRSPAEGKRLVERLEARFAQLQQAQARAAKAKARMANAGTLILIGLAALGMALLFRRTDRLRSRDAERYAAELRALTLQDPLTGLANRRQLEHDLSVAVATATPDAPVSLLLFDLNGFKDYNDAFGHHDGDLLLERLSRRLAHAVTPQGSVYRLGGDEFCALLPSAGQPPVVEACLDALSDRGDGFEITSSWGSVAIPTEASSPEAALQLADRRMYRDKDATRASAGQQTRDIARSLLGVHEPVRPDHSCAVAALAEAVCLSLGLAGHQLRDVVRAAELHDIGKVAIPLEVLNKPGQLDHEEWRLIRRHPAIGAHILNAAPALAQVADLVAASHERYDGTGYPHGLAGEEIPLGSRIVHACDAFSAMTSDRPYRKSVSAHEALTEMRRCAGTQFDHEVVEAFDMALRQQGGASSAAAAAAYDR